MEVVTFGRVGFVYDTADWRVYSAEQSLEAGREFRDIAEADAYVQDLAVELKPWWQEHYGQMPAPTLRVELGGESWGDGSMASFARPDRLPSPNCWTISVHPKMLAEMLILHEVAHCLEPRYFGDVALLRRQLRSGRIPDLGEYRDHGAMFTATLTSLVHRYGTAADHAELQEAYQHYEVPIIPAPDFLLACRGQQELHTFAGEYLEWQQTWFAASAARRAEAASEPVDGDSQQVDGQVDGSPASTEGRPVPWAPKEWWGRWLFLTRRERGRAASQRAIAEAVSVIEPCTPRSIAKLERSLERPTKRRDLRIAMATAAFLEMDPIWIRTAHGLVRWDCHVELDELRLVSPRWVDHVERLNQLLAARPPKWTLAAHR